MTRWRCSLSGEWNIEKTRGIIRGMTRKGRGIVRKKAEAPSGILRKSSGVLRGLSPSRAAKRRAATSWNWPVTRDYCQKFAPWRRCEQLDGNKGISKTTRPFNFRIKERIIAAFWKAVPPQKRSGWPGLGFVHRRVNSLDHADIDAVTFAPAETCSTLGHRGQLSCFKIGAALKNSCDDDHRQPLVSHVDAL